METPRKAKPLPSNAESKEPAKTRSLLERFGTSIVHIKVGKKLKDFGIHKSLICYQSIFFRKAFNSNFDKGRTGIMKMEETATEVFDLFFVWLYSPDAWIQETENPTPSQETLIDLYLFAEMIQTPALKNAAIHRLRVLLTGAQIEDQLGLITKFNYIWDNTSQRSTIRRLMVDLCVWKFMCGIIFEKSSAHLVRSEIYVEIIDALWSRSCFHLTTSPLENSSIYDEPTDLELKK